MLPGVGDAVSRYRSVPHKHPALRCRDHNSNGSKLSCYSEPRQGDPLIPERPVPGSQLDRVVWRPSSSGAETEAGAVTKTQFALTGQPSGVPIIVGVSARNNSGETAPTEAATVVP
jgi:hypothetical protein